MEAQAEAIFRKWGLDFAIIGKTTDTLRFVVKHNGESDGRSPDQGTRRRGSCSTTALTSPIPSGPRSTPASVKPPVGNAEALLRLVGSPDQCSKRWVFEQYDHLILGNTVQVPGGDAAIVRVARRTEGPRAHHGRDAALLRGGSCRRRQAGGGRGLAQHHGRGRPAPRRSPTTSISATPSGPRSWAPSSAASAASPRRAARWISRSCRATSRSTTRPTARVSCDPDDRRRGPPRRRCGERQPLPSSAREMRSSSSARPRAGSANRSISPSSAGARMERRPRSISLPRNERRFRAPAHPVRADGYRARLLGRRHRDRAGRDGDRRRDRAARSPGSRDGHRLASPCLFVRRRSGLAISSPAPPDRAAGILEEAPRARGCQRP